MTKKNKLSETLETQELKPTVAEVKPVAKKAVEKTQAELIWEELKDLEVSMFGLPEQKVSNFCSPVYLDDKVLFLNYKVAAVLPVLEEKFRTKYVVDAEGKMLKVSRV